MSFKKKIFVGVGVIGIIGIGYNIYHLFDGVTQWRIAYFFFEYGMPNFYVDRVVLKKDIPKAIWWTSKAAARGNANAQSALGAYLINGEGVQKNEKEGFQWLKKSAESGCAEAQYNLGTCFYNGTGTSINKEEAYKCIKDAAEQMFEKHDRQEIALNAYYSLGQLYGRGEGCEVNEKEANVWISRAQERGNVDASKPVDRVK